MSSFAFSIILLRPASVVVASMGVQAKGHLGFMKNSAGSGPTLVIYVNLAENSLNITLRKGCTLAQ